MIMFQVLLMHLSYLLPSYPRCYPPSRKGRGSCAPSFTWSHHAGGWFSTDFCLSSAPWGDHSHVLVLTVCSPVPFHLGSSADPAFAPIGWSCGYIWKEKVGSSWGQARVHQLQPQCRLALQCMHENNLFNVETF